jgi:hypothetical protein
MRNTSTPSGTIARLFFSKCALVCLPAIAFFVLGNIDTHAQTPFQDANGNGTILLSDGGFVQLNIADPSIKIGYLHDVSSQHWSFGFDASGKLTGSRAPLLNGNQAAPDLKLGLTLARKYLFARKLNLNNPHDQQKLKDVRDEAVEHGLKPNDDLGDYWSALPYDRLALQVGYAYKRYTLFDPNATFDKQVFKKQFHSPSVALTYSILLNGSNLFGISVGVNRSNNSNDLTQVDVRDINTFTSSTTIREVVRTRQVLRGDFKQSTSALVNTDYVWFPRKTFSRVGIDFYSRSVLNGEDKGFTPGMGFFLSEKGAPTRVIGGVTISYDQGKASVALVAGFSFK